MEPRSKRVNAATIPPAEESLSSVPTRTGVGRGPSSIPFSPAEAGGQALGWFLIGQEIYMAQPSGEDLAAVALTKTAAVARSSSSVRTGAGVGPKLPSTSFKARTTAGTRQPG